jgi:hypothetical protein
MNIFAVVSGVLNMNQYELSFKKLGTSKKNLIPIGATFVTHKN